MTAHDLRSSIYQVLENIDDPLILEAYHAILQNLVKIQNAQIVGYELNGNPITKLAFEQNVLEAQKRVKDGISIKHDDLKKDRTRLI